MVRIWLVTLVAVLVIAVGRADASGLLPAPKLDAEGMYQQPWLAATSGDLRQDLAAATGKGKLLAVMWEQPGCHYCREMHEVNFRQPEIVDYVNQHFQVVQFDLWGDRELVGMDGAAGPMRQVASSAGVRGTPSIQFFDETGKEVFRMPGYAPPAVFHAVFEYVATQGYQDTNFQDWARAKFARMQQDGGGAAKSN